MSEEKKIEKHFYWMPDNCEMFLAAVAAIQNYYVWLGKRKIDPQVTVYCPDESLHFLRPALQTLKFLVEATVSPLGQYTLSDYDQVVKFDGDVAYRMSEKTEKHAAQMFGIMLGSEPQKSTPDLSNCVSYIMDEKWRSAQPTTDILLLPFPAHQKVHEFIGNNRPELDLTWFSKTDSLMEISGDDLMRFVYSCRMVIGVRSGITYLAASLGKAVVEIYPPDRHRNWLSKWSNPMYQMIYAKPEEVLPGLVYRAMEAMWLKVVTDSKKRRALAQREESIRTEASMQLADDVGNSLLK